MSRMSDYSESGAQPVEDAAPAASLQAITDSAGEYTLEVPPGPYFVHVTPAARATSSSGDRRPARITAV